MILIAESGSTKTDWVLLKSSGEVFLKTKTPGLNPSVFPEDELKKRLLENPEFAKYSREIQKVYFYGAGCGTPTPAAIIKKVLHEVFPNARIEVKEDLAAAVFAVTDKPGIICILGTGSNSCYFDGSTLHLPVASLGYVLMDEGSGNYFGKELIRDYFYNRMPESLAREFESQFDLNPDRIKINLYKKPNPNAYLASFARFIFDSKEKNHSYFEKLLKKGINKFMEYRVLCFKNAKEVPIHFVGSIAYFSRELIESCCFENQLTLGKIIQKPMDGLIDYHLGRFKN